MQLPYRKPGKFAQQAKDPHITQARYDELCRDLERLKKKHPDAVKEMQRLAEMGDFSENAAYQMAKGRLRGINSAITKLEYQINHAVIIQPPSLDMVEIGTKVNVKVDGESRVYTILGSDESNPANLVISHLSPIGSALLGQKKGASITVSIGNTQKQLTIEDISPA